MFYSHEILTSRKYGVATVWLVATLGASHKTKKIGRKAIREVNVPKACRTIIDPGAPLALRLQGNLLYGVSRVYLEQCGYLLSDAENAYTNMRLMLRVIRDAALDKEAGRARPEQLVLQDDPSFLPDLTLPPPELLEDLSFLDPIRRRISGESQTLTATPYGSQTAPRTPQRPLGRLVIPSSSSGPAGGFELAGDDVPASVGDLGDGRDEERIAEPLPDDFSFDADGNFIDFATGEVMPATPHVAETAVMHSDTGASARVRAEHEQGQQVAVQPTDNQMDIDFPIFGSDLPEGDAIRPPSEHRPSSDHEGEEEDQATVTAPIKRRTRTRKPIPADQRMELHNKDLSDWNANYLDNMEEAARLKNSHRAYNEAKKTAELIVWGMGIGGIGMRPPGITAPIPIDMFCGDGLFELYTGVDRNKIIAGKKHDRDSGIDEATEAEARRVRPRTDNEFDDGEQIGRAEGADEGIRLGDAEEVELPRDAPAALDDRQLFSAMPWNLSASVRWSSAVPRSARLGSAAGTLSTAAKGSSLRQRARLASASPLQGRGTFGDSDILRGLEGGDSDIEMQHSGLPEMMSSDGGFLADDIGDEENAAGAPRVTESLSAEGGNFLAFIADAVEEKQRRAEAARDPFDDEAIGDDGSDEVLFEDLLPPQQNSKMVACQGLMMVLALGTRGLVDVRQDQPFHEIGLRLTDKGKFSHLRVVEDLAENDGGGDGGEQEGEVSEEDMEIQGDIQEQMARGMDDDADEEIEEEDDKSDSSEDDDGSDYEG